MSTLEILTDTGVRIEVETRVVVVLVWISTETGDINGVVRVLVHIHAGKMLEMLSCFTLFVIKYLSQYIFIYTQYSAVKYIAELQPFPSQRQKL